MVSKQEKHGIVLKVKEESKRHSVIAVASIDSLPSRNYSAIKKKLRGQADIVFARHTLLKMALEEGKPEAKELLSFLGNGGVLVFTSLPAFKLYKLFKQNKSKSAAKPGQVAPYDIIIPAGETNLAPGPVLTELKQAKIDAKIQGTKVVIAKDAVVAKKGDVISDQAAKILVKLGVQPMEIGIDVKAVWDNGLLYTQDVLDVDEVAFTESLKQAHAQAINLAVFAGIMNEATAQIIIAKAAREANALQKLVGSKSAAPAPAETPATQESQATAEPAPAQ
ncbi:MAG: 50S ribosomal protein L10 [Candidatus Norongarragalinales archaeon]